MASFTMMKSLAVCLLLLLRGVSSSFVDHQQRTEFVRAMDKATRRTNKFENFQRRLLEKARPLVKTSQFRVLEQANNDDAYKLDFDNYSLKYAGCQNINTWSDNKAEDEDSDTVFATQRFVVFRMCPAEHCSIYNSHGCNSDYGEYMIAMEDYLAIMSQYHYSRFEEYCSTCAKCMAYEQQQVAYQYKAQHAGEGNRMRELANYDDYYYNYFYGDDAVNDDAANDDAAADDDGGQANDDYYAGGDDAVGDDAYNYGDDAVNDDDAANDDAAAGDDAVYYNYVDDDTYKDDDTAGGNANEYSQCRYSTSCYNYEKVCSSYNENDQVFSNYFSCSEFVTGNQNVYLGPHCSGDGFSMTLAVFEDEECSTYLGDITNMQEFTGIEFEKDSLSFYHPKQCITCADQGEWNLQYDNAGGDAAASYLCEALYDASAKCHKYLSSSDGNYESENQEQTDGDVCNFIQSLEDNHYDENGEINLSNLYFDKTKWANVHEYTKLVSPAQIFGIVASVSLCLGLLIYSCCLHNALSQAKKAEVDTKPKKHDFSNSLLYRNGPIPVQGKARLSRNPSGIMQHRSRGDSYDTWATGESRSFASNGKT